MSYPLEVDLAWKVVEEFAHAWTREPYRWDSESNLQAEIAARLRVVYEHTGLGSVEGRCRGYGRSGSIPRWSRVSLGPMIRRKDETPCYPDVVVWDRREHADEDIPGQDWPVLWACELKFDGRSRLETKEVLDVQKLAHLVQKGRVRFGCFMNFTLKEGPDGASFEKRRPVDLRASGGGGSGAVDSKLWIYDVSGARGT